jgi:hypothetical protein
LAEGARAGRRIGGGAGSQERGGWRWRVSKLYKVKDDDSRYLFQCPGCGFCHQVFVKNVGGNPVWGWNGSLEKPTFTPSIKTWWDTPTQRHVCHSFVTDGNIQFLEDCTHDLRGRTVELPEVGKSAAAGGGE